jgi:hypothetical protein
MAWSAVGEGGSLGHAYQSDRERCRIVAAIGHSGFLGYLALDG